MIKQWFINWVFKNVIRVIIPGDVIVQDPKTKNIYLGSELLNNQELDALQAEAKTLEKMRLWSILNETIKSRAFEKGWSSSMTMEHLNTAKTMGYTLDLQASIVKIIRNRTL